MESVHDHFRVKEAENHLSVPLTVSVHCLSSRLRRYPGDNTSIPYQWGSFSSIDGVRNLADATPLNKPSDVNISLRVVKKRRLAEMTLSDATLGAQGEFALPANLTPAWAGRRNLGRV